MPLDTTDGSITRGLSDTLKFLKFSKDRPKHQLIVETSKIIYLQTKYTTLTDNMMNATKLNSNIGAIAHDVTHERQLSDEVRCTWNAVHFDVHIFFFRDGGTTARGNGRSRRTVPPQRITNELCIFARHASRNRDSWEPACAGSSSRLSTSSHHTCVHAGYQTTPGNGEQEEEEISHSGRQGG